MNKLIEHIKEKNHRSILTDSLIKTIVGGSDHRRYGLVKRALKGGDLLQIKRGLYVLGQKHRTTEVNQFELAQMIYGPSYISLESALSYHGLIPEAVYSVTNACLKRSKEFKTPLGLFAFTCIPQSSLYEGVERIEQDGHVFFMASPVKAILDMVYTHKKNWGNMDEVREDLRIESKAMKAMNWKSLQALKKIYRNRRVTEFIERLKKDGPN